MLLPKKREKTKPKPKKCVRQLQLGKPKKPRRKPRRKKAKTKYNEQESEDEEDETLCLVCVEAYSNSRPNETWVQCIHCKGWAHEECASIGINPSFTCQNCDTDDSDYVY